MQGENGKVRDNSWTRRRLKFNLAPKAGQLSYSDPVVAGAAVMQSVDRALAVESQHGPVKVLWRKGRPVAERCDVDAWGRPRNPQARKVANPGERFIA